jgi:hypothetical protein
MDKAGGVVIPEIVRDQLQLMPGQQPHLKSDGGGISYGRSIPAHHSEKNMGSGFLTVGSRFPWPQRRKPVSDSREQRTRRNFGGDPENCARLDALIAGRVKTP